MGGSHSRTRKLTVENDDPTSVIKVSDDVVQRIRNSQEAKPEQLSPNHPYATSPLIGGPPLLHEPSLTSIQLRQSNLTELKKNDDYWGKRLKLLEANHQKMNDIMENEYNKAVSELGAQKERSAASSAIPCNECKEAVKNCYKRYPNEPMRCARVVQAFQECVDCQRTSFMANRG